MWVRVVPRCPTPRSHRRGLVIDGELEVVELAVENEGLDDDC